MSAPNSQRVSDNDNRVYNFHQSLNLGVVFTSSTVAAANYGLAITATAHIAQFASYVALFDQYKIDSVEIWLQPQLNGANGLGELYTAIDYDAATALTPAAISQYSNVQITNGQTVGHYRHFRPHVAVGAYSGAVFTAFKNEPAGWIDTSSGTVQHYGFLATSDITPTAAIPYSLQIRVHFSVRNTV